MSNPPILQNRLRQLYHFPAHISNKALRKTQYKCLFEHIDFLAILKLYSTTNCSNVLLSAPYLKCADNAYVACLGHHEARKAAARLREMCRKYKVDYMINSKVKQNYRQHTSLLWCSAARDSSTNHDKFHCCRILTRRTFSWQNRVDRKPTRHSVQYTGHTAYHCVCVMTDRRPRDCAILISMANINDNYPSICQRIMLLSKICIKQSWTIIDICITYTSDRYIW